MTFDHLWAGWRANYVSSVSDGPENAGLEDGGDQKACVFCAILNSNEPDQQLHVVFRGKHTIAMLNAYPYTSGHLLVMPNRHVGEISQLSDLEYTDLFAVTRVAMKALNDAYDPEGMNMGANLGRAAGAGIPRHLHIHVVPRWLGDTNFMTTVASTRVMPEALSDSWQKVREVWPS